MVKIKYMIININESVNPLILEILKITNQIQIQITVTILIILTLSSSVSIQLARLAMSRILSSISRQIPSTARATPPIMNTTLNRIKRNFANEAPQFIAMVESSRVFQRDLEKQGVLSVAISSPKQDFEHLLLYNKQQVESRYTYICSR